MSEDKSRVKGFEIFRNGLVRRLSSTHYVAKNAANEPWYLIELRDGKWNCDCNSKEPLCAHLFAAQLQRTTSRLPVEQQIDDVHLKCRYCGSIDIARCGFRYNARGIVRRYVCHDCQRKFSIPYIQNESSAKPVELVWLMDEIGMLTSRLTDLIAQINVTIEMADQRVSSSP